MTRRRRQPARTVMDPTRSCKRCGSPGPFYASQPKRCYCVACTIAQAQASYARRREAILAAWHQKHVTRLQQADPLTLTRLQRLWLAKQHLKPGQKLCNWCLAPKPASPRYFPRERRQKDGLHRYCWPCRRILDALAKREREGRRAS